MTTLCARMEIEYTTDAEYLAVSPDDGTKVIVAVPVVAEAVIVNDCALLVV